jgi:two-component system sensor histidine kinase TctE
LRDLIAALLENAIAHGRGAVSASLLEDEEGFARLLIMDEGPGVPAAHWTSVFERFRKLDAASAGAGLGLSIVKSVSIALGGDAEFIAPSKVLVRLPVASAHP